MSSEDPSPSGSIPAGAINRPGFSSSAAAALQRGDGVEPDAFDAAGPAGFGGANVPSGCILL